MKIFSSDILINKAKLIFVSLLVALGFSVYFYYELGAGNKHTALLGGLSTGFVLVIIQFMFSWDDYKQRDRLRLLGLKKVLEHKKDREYYGSLIKSATKRIDLMGKSGRHFLEDFANKRGAHKESRYLLEAMARGVKVRFLLPIAAKSISNNDALEQLNKLSENENFEFRFFNYVECHSIFIADDDMIIGPFFPGVKSMDTPALHVERSAVLSQRYAEFFDDVWGGAGT